MISFNYYQLTNLGDLKLMIKKLTRWAQQLKRKVLILYFAYKDERTPWTAKIFALCVVAYAFSPVDLIPDFIPVLGYLDDLILIPLGVAVTLRMIPRPVIEDCTIRAEQRLNEKKPANWIAGSLIILVWILAFLWVTRLVLSYLGY
ncbi:hypothetical protein D3C72_1611900 [compost metagenome]